MADCPDKHFHEMLHAYELGLLTDEERRELEMHLLDCPACRSELQKFHDTIIMLRRDKDVRELIARLDREETAAEKEAAAARPKPRRRLLPTLIPASVLTLIVLFLLVLKPWQIEISPSQDAIAAQNRLAIMYFDNIADPDDSLRLGQILTNLLITDLAESRYIQVVSDQHLYDILRLLNLDKVKRIDSETATRIAVKAGARWMLLGSILQVKPQLVVTAQLVDVETGDVVASQRVTGDVDENVFSLVDKLSMEVKNDLSLPAEARAEIDRPVSEVTTHSPEAYRLYLEGVSDYNKFYMADAANEFKKALQLDSTFAMAYYYLAIISDRSLMKKAVEYAKNATQKEQMYIESRSRLMAGDTPGAIENLQKLVKRYPDEKLGWFLLGTHYYALRQYKESVKSLEKAIEIDPLYSAPYNQLAYTYDAMGDFKKSIEAINAYIAMMPDDANPYDSRAEIYARNGKITEAIASYQMALKKKPDFMNSRSQLANLYIIDRQYAQAEAQVEDLIKSVKDAYEKSSPRLMLAYIPEYQGKFNRALEILDENIAWEKKNLGEKAGTSNQHLKAAIYSEQGRWDQALAIMDKILETARRMHPDMKGDYLDLYIQILARSSRIDQAEAVADSFKVIADENPRMESDYEYALGTIQLARGRPEAAVTYFLESDKKAAAYSFSIHYWLARAYLENGQPEEAAGEFESLLRQVSMWRLYWGIWAVESYYYLGRSYEEMGRNDKAMANYKTFLDIWKNADPGIKLLDEARTRLAQLEAKS